MKTLKGYKEYKNSEVTWLGDVPAHWQVLPGRACLEEKKESNKGMVEKTVLSLSYGQIIVKSEEKLHGLVPESFETYQVINPGDIIFRPTDLQNDTVSLRFGISRNRGIITSAYMCLKPTDLLTNEYAYLLLHAYDLKKIFYGLGSGLRQNIDWRDFKYLPCLVPPIDEQKTIVRFLDHVNRRIKRYIRAKQKLIKLIDEQKKAIIQKAVTRGIDRDARIKKSRITWLGDVPEDWNTTILARVTTRIGDGLHGTPIYAEDSQYHFINGNNLENGRITITNKTRCVSEEEFYKNRTELTDNTVLLSINGTIGNLALYEGEKIILGKSAAYITCDQELKRKYLFYYLQSASVTNHFLQEVTGTTIKNLALETLRKLPILLPPIAEQTEISLFLDKELSKFIQLDNDFRKEISTMKEYHVRLVSDVVTGKLDVRSVDVQLPIEQQETMIEEELLEDPEEQEEGPDLVIEKG